MSTVWTTTARVLLVLAVVVVHSIRGTCDCDGGAGSPARSALIDLFTATSGTTLWNRSVAAQWASTTNTICDWYGVVCIGSEVRHVSLQAVGLSGSIPASIGALTGLRLLVLSWNHLTGAMPTSLNALVLLEELVLDNNQLTGPIPLLDNLARLRTLRLGFNKLDGVFPDWLGSLHQLTTLDVQGNALTGTLPQSLQNLDLLENLNLNSNRLVGTIENTMWAGMLNLRRLEMQANQLVGALPSALGACKNLSYLDLDDNQFNSTLPSAWSALVQLGGIFIERNALRGPLPSSFGALVALQNLFLNNNALDGPLPVAWGNMTGLQNFALEDNRLSGTLPSTYSAWSRIRYLALNNNVGINGTIPDTWQQLTTLTIFSVANNSISGTLPAWIRNWKNLTKLALNINRMHGTLPEAWDVLTRLEHMWFDRNNNITGTIPDSFGHNLRRMVSLDWSRNCLTGTLPASLANMAALQAMRITANCLTGTLPPAWGDGLQRLVVLDVGQNRLTGTLPPSWGRLPMIQTMGVFSNQLTGSLPSEWGAMTRAEAILVAGNQLDGTLPDEFRRLTSVIYLGLALNRFTGTLPPSWSSLMKLQTLLLQETNVSGTIPHAWDSWVDPPALRIILPLDTQLCGPLPPLWSQRIPQFFAIPDIYDPTVFDRLQHITTITDVYGTFRNYDATLPPCPLPSPPTTGAPPTPPERGVAPNVHVAVVSATTVASSVVGASVAVVVSPVLGASVVRAGRVVELLKCARDGDDGAPPDVSALRDAGLGYLLAMVVPAVAVTAVVLEAHRRQRMTPSAVRKGLSRLDVVLARWHLPGRFNCVVEALAPAALEVGLALVTLPQSGVVPSDGVLALGAVCIAAAAVALLWFAVHVTVRFAARWRASSGAPKHTTGDPSAPVLRRAAAWLHASHPAGEWEATPDRPTFVAAYGSLFDACRERRHWYLALETCLTVLVSVLAALNNADAVSCGVVLKVVGALQLMACVAMLYCRPYLARLTLLTGLLLAVLAAVVAVLSVVPDCGGCAEAATVLSEVAFWLTVALCAVDVSVRVAIEAVFPLRPANRAPEVPDDRRRLSRRARSRGASGMRGPAPDAPSTSLPLLEPPTRHAHRHGKSRESARGAAHVPLGVLDGVHGMSHRARQLHNLKQLIECIANVRSAEPTPPGNI